MKKVIVLLCTIVLHLHAFCQKDCSLEEYALLQDKPKEISNMSALDVIQGRSKYAGTQDHTMLFYHVQTFPYPMDYVVDRKYGWTIIRTKGHRHWEYQFWIVATHPPSINITLLVFLCIAFIISMVYVLDKNPDWKTDSVKVLKKVQRPKSWKDTKSLVSDIGNSILKDIGSAPVLIPIVVAVIVTAVGLFFTLLVLKFSHDFGFFDFLMRSIAFTIVIYAGIITGRGFLFLAKQIKTFLNQKPSTVVT